MNKETVLQCQGVRSGYGTSEVITGIDLEVYRGDIYALIGKNGAGKTTLLRTIIRTIELYGGTVSILGNRVDTWKTHEVMDLPLTCAPQDSALFQDLSVEINLRLGCLKLSQAEFARALERAIDMFPFIAKRLDQKAGTLSGGEQGMVKLARAVIPQPDFILLDEITEGLNPIMVNRIIEILKKEHQDRNITIFLIEQHIDFVLHLASRFGLIVNGQMTGEGRIDDPDSHDRIMKHLLI